MNSIKNIFKLSDIKFFWILFLSMIVFLLSFCIERYYDASTLVETAMYGVGFAIAFTWGILNYLSHLKFSAIYKKHDDISKFVETMKMSKDEKIELSQYLNDFAKDLENNGEAREDAVKKAISHFQVQEFLEASGVEIFEKPTHWYMIGYALIFLGIALIVSAIYQVLTIPIFALTAFTFVLFGIGILVLFFIYKATDVLMTKK